MANVGVDIDVKQLQQALAKLPVMFERQVVRAGLLAAARVARRKARERNFRFYDRTGAARRSIKVTRRTFRNRGGRQLSARLELGGDGARHAPLLEVGTRRVKARNPIRRAVEQTGEEQVAAARPAMVREMEKVAKKLRG